MTRRGREGVTTGFPWWSRVVVVGVLWRGCQAGGSRSQWAAMPGHAPHRAGMRSGARAIAGADPPIMGLRHGVPCPHRPPLSTPQSLRRLQMGDDALVASSSSPASSPASFLFFSFFFPPLLLFSGSWGVLRMVSAHGLDPYGFIIPNTVLVLRFGSARFSVTGVCFLRFAFISVLGGRSGLFGGA